MADSTLYLFDGSNLYHAGGYDSRDELVDQLASFVALRGARGVVVFDGIGVDRELGGLVVRFAAHADDLLERLAAEHRGREEVTVVTSDEAVRETAGREVRKVGSRTFLDELAASGHVEPSASRVRDRLDAATAARLERLRRGQG